MTQVEQGQSETCPACQTEDIDHSVEEFEGVCDSCGFVLQQDTNSVELEWEITDGAFQRPEKRDWLSECHVRNATEQQLAEAFNHLEDFAEKLSLSEELREGGVDLYCDAFRAELTDGRKTPCIVAACLRLASRQLDQPVPKSRFTDFSGVDKTKFNRSNLVLCEELDIGPHLPKPKEYIPFLQTQLELADAVWNATERILTTVEGQQSFIGKDPAGVAAGAVYVSQDEHTQWDVAKAVGLSTETVRQRIKQLREVIDDV
ncbi:transcription initiation factor IIB family protein [Natrinema zhouii]|uniref:Transcription initiation factor IIB family protein n=1 Tax=Natrinema zhouii TaxID=1710539 RepID=A0A7D6GZ55_9EURY|nr:transcription initiation factor IIB family protein [Natrinema zhouii]QLK25545.1 transcription initiation factor IIB family protein [Natrinema zhouii]